MHSNETGRVYPRTLVDRKQKCYVNTVDVVEHPRDPTDPSAERTAPPCSARVQHDDVPRALDPVECRGRASSARRRDDDDDGDAIGTGLRLSTATI